MNMKRRRRRNDEMPGLAGDGQHTGREGDEDMDAICI
jgi:hypothetical protein